jgi:hypothetical protein
MQEEDRFDYLRAQDYEVLASPAESEIRRFSRDTVCSLYVRRGPFWNEISAMRRRWAIDPPRELPPIRNMPGALYPNHWDPAKNKDHKYQALPRWMSELRSIADRVVPEEYRRRTDTLLWETFISACVLYDPPHTALPEFAAFGYPYPVFYEPPWPPDERWEEYAIAVPATVGLPIQEIRDPDRAEAIERRRWQRILEAVGERLDPLGFDIRVLIRDALDAHPEIELEYAEEWDQNYSRYYVDLEEATDEELRYARRAVPARTTRKKRTKPRRDRLMALQCAILRQRGYTFGQIADRYGWYSEDTAENYVKDGLQVLEGSFD